MENERARNDVLGRRTLITGAAWSAPLILGAVAAPLAIASTSVNVGDFQVLGSCGVLGLLGPGFTVQAGTSELPAGTRIAITGSGVANIGLLDVNGGAATVDVLSPSSRAVVLTAPLAAGATLELRTALSIAVAFTLNAALTLPSGYGAGAEAKSSGSVRSTLILCSAT
ncbi:hypothetical protein [Pseudoclavibacter terrae]|uniref:hypothetical protein n=1 Tax=Pseudoclavibacter terrae TaxID=1530195 RepID=UPI00232E2B06|nr:hypothetical protein [Pseudoclavibacter terrae]